MFCGFSYCILCCFFYTYIVCEWNFNWSIDYELPTCTKKNVNCISMKLWLDMNFWIIILSPFLFWLRQTIWGMSIPCQINQLRFALHKNLTNKPILHFRRNFNFSVKKTNMKPFQLISRIAHLTIIYIFIEPNLLSNLSNDNLKQYIKGEGEPAVSISITMLVFCIVVSIEANKKMK